MTEIDIKLNHGKKIDDFFSTINEVYSINKDNAYYNDLKLQLSDF